jgi:sugar/nucleoside kinase (ribokinase family)
VTTYVAIGSACWDEVDGDEDRRLGGSVLFAGQVARAAGWDVRVITSGTPALAEAVRDALPGIEVVVQPSEHDTVMWFPRDADLGPSAVPTVADPIDLAAASEHLAAADVVHLAPIMGELTPELVAAAARAPFVGITPQGMLRTRDTGDHRLELVTSPHPWWAASTQAVVLSEGEFAHIGEPLVAPGRAVAVTRGERGCMGWCDDEVVDLPGIPLAAVAQTGTIGAGDVFASSLFLALAEGLPFADAMDRANRTAAAHVGGLT